MITGLRLNNVIVIECHETLWRGIEDRVKVASGEWLKLSFWWRLLNVYWRLLKQYLKIDDYDVLVVGYPGQFDIYLARILSWIKHKPLVWDVFMSLYLISIERGLDKKNKFTINLIYRLEKMALKIPDVLIMDTNEYVHWINQNYGIQSERFRLVPTGADDRIFFPIPSNSAVDSIFQVIYFGTYISNHGVMYIVEAAKLLADESEIQFDLIGKGPELEKVQKFVIENKLSNVSFIEWMEKDQLTRRISHADVCLGAFGTTPQSLITVQNKIYEALAMGKPLISGDSPAVRQVCTHMENIYLCERASAKSLADAILTLWKEPSLREKIAENGYRLFIEQYCLAKNGSRYKTHLVELLG
jgi:glycosyltransferase involved in cell wall biosynthesis